MSSDPPVQGPVEEPLAHQSESHHHRDRKRVRKKAHRRSRDYLRLWRNALIVTGTVVLMLLMWYFLAALFD
jgi:hypothetical protein